MEALRITTGSALYIVGAVFALTGVLKFLTITPDDLIDGHEAFLPDYVEDVAHRLTRMPRYASLGGGAAMMSIGVYVLFSKSIRGKK